MRSSSLSKTARIALAAASVAMLMVLPSCGDPELTDSETTGGASDTVEDAIRIVTSTPEQRAQYDANVSFALNYRARCGVGLSTNTSGTRRPRVIVTGFGRFLSNPSNATGRMVAGLVPGMRYPMTTRPPEGQVDDPAPQTAVASATVMLEGVGAVDVCAMVLPVYWDLAAILVLKEVQAFGPDFVMMNGIAGERQELWLELGSVNRALVLPDGSDVLVPAPPSGARFAPIVPSASASELALGLRLSYSRVQRAALDAIATKASVVEGGERFDAFVRGVFRAGFPRDSNTYLCNNTTYVVNYAMAHPNTTLTLMQASPALSGRVNRVGIKLTRDARAVPRVFVHWPSALTGAHLDAGRSVMRAIIAAQILASREGGASAPVVGTNADAEIMASGGNWF
jgi:pyrrolidone-carboxylate peptidase